jgi:hypothetical protein
MSLGDWLIAKRSGLRRRLPFVRPTITTRTDLLNLLVRRRHYRSYLEIGVRAASENLDRVRAPIRDGVDPAPTEPIAYQMTSDAFFAGPGKDKTYDLVFIDGLHIADQVLRDVENSLRVLAPGGALVIHDCNPQVEATQLEQQPPQGAWHGTVWKAWVELRCTRPDLRMYVVDVSQGCGVIERGEQDLLNAPPVLDWAYLQENRTEALNLVSVDDFIALVTTQGKSNWRGRWTRKNERRV